MSVSKNSITGDAIQTKTITEQYRNNFDVIFRKPVVSETEIKLVEEHEISYDK